MNDFCTPMEIAKIKKLMGFGTWEADVAETLLVTGLDKTKLEETVALCLHLPIEDARVSTARMNLVGGLRAAGYLVEGGRKGGSVYKVVGFEEKRYRPPVDQWTGTPKEVYDWVHTELSPLNDNGWRTINPDLAKRDASETLHENSWMYIWCYEAANDLAWYVFDDQSKSSAIVLQKHRNVPRFRLFELYATPQWLLQMAEYLAQGSTHPVSIVNTRLESTNEFKRLHRSGTWGRRTEALYDVRSIALETKKYLNDRAMTTLRKRMREHSFLAYSEPMSPFEKSDQLQLIETWKKLNESKHRQLAIERDRKAIRIDYPGRITFGVKTLDGQLTAHHMFDRLANRPQIVMLMNEKSLNYNHFEDGTPVPGGAYGMSILNQIWACTALAEMGVTHVQSGGIDGGGVGLPAHKKQFASSFIESRTFYTTFEPGAPK